MKKITLFLASLLMLQVCVPAYAALSESDRQTFPASYNLLLNGGFEQTKAKWTASAGTFTTQATTLFAGNASASWVLSAATGSLSQDVTPTVAVTGVPIEASCWVNTTATTLQVCARSGGSEVLCSAAPSSGTWQKVSLNIAAPSSGSVGVDVSTTASTTGTVYVDQCYVGPATNLTLINQVGPWTTYTPSYGAGVGTATSVKAIYRRVGESIEIVASFVTGTPTAAVADITLPSGLSVDTAKLTLANTTSGTGHKVGEWATNTANQWGNIVTATGTDATKIYISVGQSGTNALVPTTSCSTNAITGTSQPVGWHAMVPILSWSAVQILGPDATAASWGGYQTVASGWTTSSTTYADPGAGTTVVTNTTASRNVTCSSSGTSAAISCTLPKTGMYEVCAYPVITASSGNVISARLVDGSATVINAGTGISGSTSNDNPISLCGQYNATSVASAVVFKVQTASQTPVTVTIATPPPTGSAAIAWTVKQLDAAQPAPLLTGSVTSNTSGIERIERLKIVPSCTSSPCTIASQSGSWVSSVTRSIAGQYVVNFSSGMFTAAPSCTVRCMNNSNAMAGGSLADTTTSALTVDCYITSTAARADAGFDLICQGPR